MPFRRRREVAAIRRNSQALARRERRGVAEPLDSSSYAKALMNWYNSSSPGVEFDATHDVILLGW